MIVLPTTVLRSGVDVSEAVSCRASAEFAFGFTRRAPDPHAKAYVRRVIFNLGHRPGSCVVDGAFRCLTHAQGLVGAANIRSAGASSGQAGFGAGAPTPASRARDRWGLLHKRGGLGGEPSMGTAVGRELKGTSKNGAHERNAGSETAVSRHS